MRVAVVGSGVSGLAATWLLNEHSDHTIDLYEADSRPGGHAHTVRYTPKGAEGESIDVDTGFIVFNPSTYPNFLRFLRLQNSTAELILPTEMTFSVSRDGGEFEWAGKNLFTVFCQPKNLVDPAMWRLIWDVARFNATAGRILLERQENLSIGEYLDREGYSASFRDNYLIPMTAAIWSTPADKCAIDFPAVTLILSKLGASHLHLSSPVESLTRLDGSQILLRTSTGVSEKYDHVILACHSDDALRILRNGEGIEGGRGVTPQEEKILGKFQWNKNEVVLHSDVRLMPQNSDGKERANSDGPVHGMNDLQHIPELTYGPVLVTLNAPFEPYDHLVAGRWKYDHPVLDHDAVEAQQQMPSIQGVDGVSFAGAYLRYGFHEDGFTSGLVAVAALSSSHAERRKSKGAVRLPFEIKRAAKDAHRSLGIELLAVMFEWMEASGVRALVGLAGGAFLAFLRMFLV
ncbi:hypothetical protein C0991_008545 [Blastosporella zonata]|nr:hypothetical protein C0991_008545 [Blastosporella zonata]